MIAAIRAALAERLAREKRRRAADIGLPIRVGDRQPAARPPERTYLMLAAKAAWAEPAIGPNDQQFPESPAEAISEGHERLGLARDDS